IRKTTFKSVKSEVIFGAPSEGCGGVGICRIIAGSLNIQYKCPKVSALISLTEEGKIKMKFAKNSMQPRFMKRHFRWLLFQVMEPYAVPETLLNKLNQELQGYTINPGIYQVWETRDWMIVEF
ncbi:MAG: hypothetical protein WCR52_20780, partial [Bacteroidota bacterium]